MVTHKTMSELEAGMFSWVHGRITNVWRYTGKRGRPMALVTINGDTRKNIVIGFGESLTIVTGA